MENYQVGRLSELYNEMYILLRKEEKLRKETEKVLDEAKASIDPRQEFNKWLKSKEGQTWKDKQFKYQERKCAYCSELLLFPDAVVHHVLPLKDFGRTANKPENL